MSLYLIIIIAVIAIPFLLSFEKNLRYYRKWKFLFTSILITMIPFLIWDHYFTTHGYWGFNPSYLMGWYLFKLPLEEILFFVVVPYSSLFGYYAIRFHFPRYKINEKATTLLFVFLLVIAISAAASAQNQPYTLINFLFFGAILILVYGLKKSILQSYFAIFPVLLIPFLIVNGLLTGTGIEGEIVWYKPEAFSGMRFLTIPVEDFFYAFSLILSVLFFTELFQKNKTSG